jgi:hypothetical protein
MLINKEIVKEVANRSCLRLAYFLSNEKNLLRAYKDLLENGVSLDDVDDDEKDSKADTLFEILRLNPSLAEELKKEALDNASELTKLIISLRDYDEVSQLSRRYYSKLYANAAKRADTVDGSLDGVPLVSKKAIEENTLKLIKDDKVKVIFEGQFTYNDKYLARWDIAIKNSHSLDIIELKGSKKVFKNKNQTKHKKEYFYDLLFQYYVYLHVVPNYGYAINSLNFLTLNGDFKLENENETYPLKDQYLDKIFAPLTTSIHDEKLDIDISLLEYMNNNLTALKPLLDVIETSLSADIDKVEMKYFCRECLFKDDCLKRCGYPDKNCIFLLTNEALVGGNYLKTTYLIENLKLKDLNDISDDYLNEKYPESLHGFHNVARMQIESSKKDDYEFIDIEKIKELLDKDYSIYPLIFFDFETFSYPYPIVNNQKSYEQVCSQYSMHVVHQGYDIFNHDYDKGVGGGIKHYEYIGNPRNDRVNNPEINLIKTFISQLKKENVNIEEGKFTLITYNKNFEYNRFKNMASKYDEYRDFLNICADRCVDLRDFFTKGYYYRKEFNGRTSLKVVSPAFKNDIRVKEYYSNAKFNLDLTLNYKSDDNTIHNGGEALEAYQTLIRAVLTDNVDDSLHDEVIKGLLYYCKKDSWGTVVIFDIINAIKNKHLFAKNGD